MEDNKNINNTEEVKEETKKKPMGIDLSSLPDPEEETVPEEFPASMRTLVMKQAYIDELYTNVFVTLGITEDNGLIRVIPMDDGNLCLAWDTVNLSLEEDEELFIAETEYKAALIEVLLYGRYNDGLMPGALDIEGNKYRVLGSDNPIITQSFELVVDFNNKDVTEGINLIKDTLKLPPSDYDKIFISKRPASADSTGFTTPKCSIIIINRSEEEMDNLSTAYRTERFGRKVNKAINKSSQTVYGTAKMVGQKIIVPAAEVAGATFGTLAGASAQSMCVAAVEGANEFRKSFNTDAIKNRTATQELIQAITKGRKRSTRGGSF